MTETIGSIQVIATINTKDYDSAKKRIEKSNDDLEEGADKTSSGFKSAWVGAIAGVAASVTNELINTIKNLGGEMTEMYDASVKFPKVLESMGATQDEANKSFKDLQKYANLTIFSLKDMTETYGSLYGIVGKNSGKLVTALGGVSALAGDAQQAMKSWSLQLTQMVSKPTVAWQDFRILLEQNPAAIAKISEAMGITSKEIVSKVMAGKIATDDFLKALDKVGNSKDLQRQAESSDIFSNSLGQLEASVVTAGSRLLKIFGPSLINIINKSSEAVDSVSSSVVDFINFIKKNGDIFVPIAVGIGAATTAILLWNAALTIQSWIKAFSVLGLGVQAFLQLENAGKLVTAAQWAMNAAMDANPIGIIIVAIAALVAGLIYFFTQTKTGKKILQGFFGFISDSFNNIVKWAKLAWEGTKIIFGSVASWFKNVFSNAWQAVKNVFSMGGKVFAGIKSGILGVFKTVVNGIIGGINTVIRVPFDAINGALKKLKEISIVGKHPFSFLPTIAVPQIPKLADGAIATSATIAMIGEGKEPEAVLPLSKLDDMLDRDGKETELPPINVTIQARTIDSRNDLRNIALETIEAYNEVLHSRGLKKLPT